MFQSLNPPPIQHTIIEAHKDVLAQMKSKGWYDKPGVKILEGRWQDFTEGELCGPHGGWDIIYIDTFAEDYKGNMPNYLTMKGETLIIIPTYTELRNFFDILPNLLSGPEARFSFFNGLGATSIFFLSNPLTSYSHPPLSKIHRRNYIRRLYSHFRTASG